MALIVLSESRQREESARALAGERAWRAQRRGGLALLGAVVASDLVQLFFWGLSMHQTGDAAQAARWLAALFAPAPVLMVIIHQLRRGD